MVQYALQKYNGDASRVFVTGESSGAMMTVRVCLDVLSRHFPTRIYC
jgi:predicted peptidase